MQRLEIKSKTEKDSGYRQSSSTPLGYDRFKNGKK
uniref:Uncharacterized protein n=1 Tax=Anguilla anguilla TaxID=7936 RepID=A0A0E9QDB8_ANGAN